MDPTVANTARLPDIPGGWAARNVTVKDHTFLLTLPADPDAFLDDSRVQAAHNRDGYMPYWPYLWPAAHSMAQAVLSHNWPAGTRTLEIGAGVGLVGLAALTKGLKVTFSDYDRTAVELALHNARQNGFSNAAAIHLDWRKPTPLSFPIVLGCDVLYETGNHTPIRNLLETTLTDDGVCWLGDPGRQHAGAFSQLARTAGFCVEERNASGQVRRKQHNEACLPTGEFRILSLIRTGM